MATATVAAANDLYISRATIQLRRPLAEAPPRIYEWRTQVNPEESKEQLIVASKQSKDSTTAAGAAAAAATATLVAATAAAAATPIYTPPRIQGNEAQRKNLPQTLSNFYEAERYDSAWNRVTK